MTKEQFEAYNKSKQEIKPVRDFLTWCGDKYHTKGICKYRFLIFGKRKLFFQMKAHFMRREENLFEIPDDLQDEIIKVVERWVDKKEQELLEI